METSTPAWSESTLGDLTAHQAVRDLKLGDEGKEAVKNMVEQFMEHLHKITQSETNREANRADVGAHAPRHSAPLAGKRQPRDEEMETSKHTLLVNP